MSGVHILWYLEATPILVLRGLWGAGNQTWVRHMENKGPLTHIFSICPLHVHFDSFYKFLLPKWLSQHSYIFLLEIQMNYLIKWYTSWSFIFFIKRGNRWPPKICVCVTGKFWSMMPILLFRTEKIGSYRAVPMVLGDHVIHVVDHVVQTKDSHIQHVHSNPRCIS